MSYWLLVEDNIPGMESRQRIWHTPIPMVAEIAAVVFFVFGLGLWTAGFPRILTEVKILARPAPGDLIIGTAAAAAFAGIAGIISLAVALPLAMKARRLPRWFRIVTVISPAIAFLLGLAFWGCIFLMGVLSK